MTDISSDTAIANLTDAISATLANRFSRIANVVDDFGATGNGTTDDTTSLQNALDSSANHAILLFPAGYTFLHHGLTIPANSEIVLNGKLLLTSNSIPVSSLTIAGSNVSIVGSGTIDGNANGQTGGAASGGIVNNGSPENLYFRGLTITNCLNWPFSITNGTNSWLVACTLSSSGNSVEFADGCSNCHIIGNTITSIADEGISIYGGCMNCSVIDNIVSECSASGISVLNDSSQPAICSNIKIFGNTCFNSGLSGIEVNSGAGAAGPHINIQVVNNICYSNNNRNIAELGDINFGNALKFTCSSNLIYDTIGAAVFGIYIGNSTQEALILGNNIYNIGTSGAASAGIGIQNVPNVFIVGNKIYEDRSTPYMQSGIQCPSGVGKNIVIINNNISGMQFGSIYLYGGPANDTYIKDKDWAFSDPTFVVYTPSGVSSETIASNKGTCIISGSLAIPSLLLTMPSDPTNGQIQRIVFDVSGGISSLTINTSIGTIRYAPTSQKQEEGTCLSWQWNSSSQTWYRLQ